MSNSLIRYMIFSIGGDFRDVSTLQARINDNEMIDPYGKSILSLFQPYPCVSSLLLVFLLLNFPFDVVFLLSLTRFYAHFINFVFLLSSLLPLVFN